MRRKKKVPRHKLFYILGDPDSAAAKLELTDAGVRFSLNPVDDADCLRLGRDHGITRFPALVSDKAAWLGLPAILSFILRKRGLKERRHG